MGGDGHVVEAGNFHGGRGTGTGASLGEDDSGDRAAGLGPFVFQAWEGSAEAGTTASWRIPRWTAVQERQIPCETGICPGDMTLLHQAQTVFSLVSGCGCFKREGRRMPGEELAAGQSLFLRRKALTIKGG